MTNPVACAFNPQELRCTGTNRMNCLNSEELKAVEHVHTGPETPQGNTLPGISVGTQGQLEFAAGAGKRRHGLVCFDLSVGLGPSWNWTAFDFDKDITTMDQRLGLWLNATDPDIVKFRQMEHKLLLSHDGPIPGGSAGHSR